LFAIAIASVVVRASVWRTFPTFAAWAVSYLVSRVDRYDETEVSAG
jgi:hypothetical protein